MTLLELFKRIYPGTYKEFIAQTIEVLRAGGKRFVVTANPEILMRGSGGDGDVERLLSRPETVMTPDGISVVSAMRQCGLPAAERITGVELARDLLTAAGESGLTVCLLGAREEVVMTLAKNLREEFPKLTVHAHNGYDGDKDAVMETFLRAEPDLMLVALGVPGQEKLIDRWLDRFPKGVFMGVGGSFDVLSGLKRRAPDFFLKTNTEWLYRVLREPKRLKRFYESNVKFVWAARRAAREAKRTS